MHASSESDSTGLSFVLRGSGNPFVTRDRFLAMDRVEEADGMMASGPPVKPVAKWGITRPTVTFTSQLNSSGSRSTDVPVAVLPISLNEFWEGSREFDPSSRGLSMDMRLRTKTLTFSTPNFESLEVRTSTAVRLASSGTMGSTTIPACVPGLTMSLSANLPTGFSNAFSTRTLTSFTAGDGSGSKIR